MPRRSQMAGRCERARPSLGTGLGRGKGHYLPRTIEERRSEPLGAWESVSEGRYVHYVTRSRGLQTSQPRYALVVLAGSNDNDVICAHLGSLVHHFWEKY